VGPDLTLTPSLFVSIIETVGLSITLLAISVIDIKTLRIPDFLSLPLIGVGLGIAIHGTNNFGAEYFAGAIVGFLLFAGLGEVYFRSRGVDGLGLGDAKLFAAAGAWLGWSYLPLVLLLAASGGLMAALMRRNTAPDAPLALGPWISLSLWLVYIWASGARGF
jgi:leader peptidase (prepilin peptidase) / N-methyltransferase